MKHNRPIHSFLQQVKKNLFYKIILGLVALVLLFIVATYLFIDPWLENKFRTAVNKNNSQYTIDIKKIHASVFTLGLKLGTISIRTKPENREKGDILAEIESANVEGISLKKAIFDQDFLFGEVNISNIKISGTISGKDDDSVKIILSPLNLGIKRVHINSVNLLLNNIENSQIFSLKNVDVSLYNLHLSTQDTLSIAVLKQFECKAELFSYTSSDSMYTASAIGFDYSTKTKTLALNTFSVRPNYPDYEFTSRLKYQSDCVHLEVNKINVADFKAIAFIKAQDVECSGISIENMNIHVFRDMRKPTKHVNIPMLQDLIRDYPAKLNVDSIHLKNGNVKYVEHAAKANHAGRISFNDMEAYIYCISNDTVLKSDTNWFVLKSTAMLMDKSKLKVLLKNKLFDNQNTFTVEGNLSGMDVRTLNPILERNAFFYATSGKIDKMNFNFTADKNNSSGKLTMFYHGLEIAVKNKETDDTTGLGEKIISFIANIKILNSNPLPGDEIRVGTIEYKRDPEKFLFNYCLKSILSGITTSMVKQPKKK